VMRPRLQLAVLRLPPLRSKRFSTVQLLIIYFWTFVGVVSVHARSPLRRHVTTLNVQNLLLAVYMVVS